MNSKTLFDSFSEIERQLAAALCGMESESPAFRSTLRTLPAEGCKTIGDMARAYLRAKLAELEGHEAAAKAERDRVIIIPLTSAQRQIVAARLASDVFDDVFKAREGQYHLAGWASDRAVVLLNKMGVGMEIVCNGTELDRAIVSETLSGDAFNDPLGTFTLDSAARRADIAFGNAPQGA